LDVPRQVVLSQSALAERLQRRPSPIMRFISDFTQHGFAFGTEGITMHDPLAIGVALDPSLVGFEPLHVEIECDGRITRGMSVADRRGTPPPRPRAPPRPA